MLPDINDPGFSSTISLEEVPNVLHDIICLPGKDRAVTFPPFPFGQVGDPDMLAKDFGHISFMENAHERGLSTEAANRFPHSASTPSMQQKTAVEASISPIRIKEPQNIEPHMEESPQPDLEDEIIQILSTTCTANLADISTSASLMVTLSQENSGKSLERMVESLKPHSKFPTSAIVDRISAIRAPGAGRPILGTRSSKAEGTLLSSLRQSPQPMDVDDDSPSATKETSLVIVFDPPSDVHAREISMKIKPKPTFKYAVTYSQIDLSKPSKDAIAALQRSADKKVENFPDAGDVWIHTNSMTNKYSVWQYVKGTSKGRWSECTASYKQDTGTIIHPKYSNYTLSRSAGASYDDPAYLTTSWVSRRGREIEMKRAIKDQAAETVLQVAEEQAAESARLAEAVRKSVNSHQSASSRIPWRVPSSASQPSSSRSRRRRVSMEEITDDET